MAMDTAPRIAPAHHTTAASRKLMRCAADPEPCSAGRLQMAATAATLKAREASSSVPSEATSANTSPFVRAKATPQAPEISYPMQEKPYSQSKVAMPLLIQFTLSSPGRPPAAVIT